MIESFKLSRDKRIRSGVDSSRVKAEGLLLISSENPKDRMASSFVSPAPQDQIKTVRSTLDPVLGPSKAKNALEEEHHRKENVVQRAIQEAEQAETRRQLRSRIKRLKLDESGEEEKKEKIVFL